MTPRYLQEPDKSSDLKMYITALGTVENTICAVISLVKYHSSCLSFMMLRILSTDYSKGSFRSRCTISVLFPLSPLGKFSRTTTRQGR